MSTGSATVIPSRMNLQILKQRRQNAYLGFSLLKRKGDALTAKFHRLLRDTVQVSLGEDEPRLATCIYGTRDRTRTVGNRIRME